MKRGDVIRVAGSGNFAGKPRPAVIVQADEYCDAHESLTVAPLTSMLQPSFAFRVHVHANAANGLNADSDAEVDKVQAVKRHRTPGSSAKSMFGRWRGSTTRYVNGYLSDLWSIS